MEVQTSSVTLRKLEPSEGMVLTQSSDDTALADRYFSKLIYLGSNDSEDNYKEITDAEAEEIKAQQEAAREAERKAKMESRDTGVEKE